MGGMSGMQMQGQGSYNDPYSDLAFASGVQAATGKVRPWGRHS